ncbi:MAG TPA: outer membrane beta-barrel protein [Telmatospirillum sp.]|nr:outer membrane beta-barrel protein [Telmatospirillum sp.]
MRKYLLGLGTVAALFVSGQSAMADGPWYVSGSLGAYIRQDFSNTETFHNTAGASGPVLTDRTFDPGPVVNLAFGRRILGPFRVEGELGYAHYDIDTANPRSINGALPGLNGSKLSANSGGDYDRFTATANAFYDFPMFGRLMPYVGGGFGYAHTEVSTAQFIKSTGGTVTLFGGNDDSAVILGEVGGAVFLNNSWSIVPSYRFEHLFNNAEENGHILKVGLRYSL